MKNTSRLHFDGEYYACTLVTPQTPFDATLDLALVHCPMGVPVAPSFLSTNPYRLYNSAAMLGWSLGTHIDVSRMIYVTTKDGSFDYAPHVRFTRLATSFQTPNQPNITLPPSNNVEVGPNLTSSQTKASGETVFVSSSAPPTAAQKNMGFLHDSPEPGMSGGAVVDMYCGLWGILSKKSVWGAGGAFIRMTPEVTSTLLEAAAQYAGGGSRL